MNNDWKRDLFNAIDLSGMFAWQVCEKEYARQALKGAFDAGVGFEEFLDEVEKAVETRMGSNVGQVDEGVLKERKRVARKLAQKLEQYFL